MKVALCRPNYQSHLITPPLGIGYLSSYLKMEGVETKIIDGLKSNMNEEEIVKEASWADLVGVTMMSSYYIEAKAIIKKLKSRGKKVVIGGPLVTALPRYMIKNTCADYAVIGEGEKPLLKIVKAMAEKKQIKRLHKAGYIKNLSGLPIPDWEQMDPRRYPRAPHGGVVKHFPVAPVITSRGCPFECKFCASPMLWQRRIRFRQPEEVVEEIEYLKWRFGVREIHFEDDNLTLGREHVEKICRLMIKKKLDLAWATPNGIRADKVDLSLLRLMKRSGCYFVAFGIESGNQQILDEVAKHSRLAVIEKAVRLAHRAGLLTQGFFIFGLPGETEATIEQTIKFAKKLPLDKAQFLLLDVIPGSALWDELKFADKVNWALDSFHEVSWCPETIDKEALRQAQGKAFRSFFLRPKQTWGMLKLIKPSQLPYVIRRLRDFRVAG